MKVSYDQLESKLAGDHARLPALIWVAGNEPLLVIESSDLVRNTARKLGYSERTVINVDRYTKSSDIQGAAGSMSLFAEQRLVELRIPTGRFNKDLGELLAELLPTLGDDTRFLVSSEPLEKTVTQASWFNQLDKLCWHVSIYALKRSQLPQWLGDRLMRQGQTADRPLLEWLSDKVEGNLLAAQQEVRKLALLCDKGKLDPLQVQQVVLSVARFDSFSVIDSAVAGDASRALRGLEGLKAEGEALPLIVWAFSEAARALYKLCQAKNKGQNPAALTMQLRLFGPREALFVNACQRLSLAQCATILNLVAGADRLAKGINDSPAPNRTRVTDPWEILSAAACLIAGKQDLAIAA
jgi:DNA polymerase III subunit delta